MKTDAAIARLHQNKYFHQACHPSRTRHYESERNHSLLHSSESPTQHYTVLRRVTNHPHPVDVLLFSCCLGETRVTMQVHKLKLFDKPVSFQSLVRILARQILHFSPQNAPQCPTK